MLLYSISAKNITAQKAVFVPAINITFVSGGVVFETTVGSYRQRFKFRCRVMLLAETKYKLLLLMLFVFNKTMIIYFITFISTNFVT